ncbi:MAG TPA: hypothetical protein VNK43_12445 [Gemmatimonadales bacterium]|nr:hypothetical protein [Gemmatimonadales bacterium]
MTDAAPARPRRRLKPILVGLVLAPLLLGALYTAAALSFAYSDGYRAGVLQKFSRKGWLCKTYEGELAQAIVPGVAPTIWHFSVRDDRVAEQLNRALGRRVSLHYREHRGVPTDCFGQTDYFVDSVAVVE